MFNKQLTFVIIAIFAFQVGRGQTQAQAQKPPVTPQSTAPIELRGVSTSDTISIPVNLANGQTLNSLNPQVHPVYVLLNNQSRQSYIDGLQLSVADTKVPVLRLIIDRNALSDSGAYHAFFQIGAPNPQTTPLELVLHHAGARLDTICRVFIHIDGTSVRCDPLQLRETGNQSAVRNLQVINRIFPGITDSTFITIIPDRGNKAAGTRFIVPYRFNADYASSTDSLPLGTTIGSVDLQAPGLSNIVTVPVVIDNRRRKEWIILMTFVGILCGALIRTYINSRKQTEEGRVKGYNLIRQIRDETKKIRDKSFQTKIDNMITALKSTLMSETDPTVIQTKITETVTNYNKEKTDFDKDLDSTTEDVNKLTTCLANIDLPSGQPGPSKPGQSGPSKSGQSGLSTPGRLGPIKNLVTEAGEALQKLDVETAKAKIGVAIPKINGLVSDQVNNTATLLTQLNSDGYYPSLFAVESIKAAKDEAQKVQQKFQAIKTDTTDVKGVTDAIYALNASYSSLHDLLIRILSTGTAAYATVNHDNPNSETAIALKKAFDAWSAQLTRAMANPGLPLDKTVVDTLNAAWAAAKTTQPTLRITRGSGSPLADQHTTGVLGLINPPGTVPRHPVGEIHFTPATSGMATIDDLANRSRSNLVWLTIVQILGLSLVLCLLFYNTYGQNFVGTSSELINLFLLGFSIDISIDGVLKLINPQRTG